jgi:hypothetical protein
MSTADVVRLATETEADTRGVIAATEPDVVPKAPSSQNELKELGIIKHGGQSGR